MDQFFKKLINIINFESSDTINDKSEPTVTTGSIFFGVLVRTAIIILLSLFLVDYFYFRGNWWIIAVAMWFLVAYPAYRRFRKFSDETDEFLEQTLCGKCRYFDPSNKLCTILDEHPTENYTPCGGDSWEPRQNL